MIRRPPRSTPLYSSAASDVYKRQVLLRKKDGSHRLCVDYRAVNSVTYKDTYPLPHIDTCLESMDGLEWFTTLDLRSGYHNIPIKEADRDKTAFITRSVSRVPDRARLRLPLRRTLGLRRYASRLSQRLFWRSTAGKCRRNGTTALSPQCPGHRHWPLVLWHLLRRLTSPLCSGISPEHQLTRSLRRQHWPIDGLRQ